MSPRLLGFAICAGVLLLAIATAGAADTAEGSLESYGLRLAYGSANRGGLTFASLLPRLSFILPAGIERPLSSYHLRAEWVSELIVSSITNGTDTVEAGVNPLFFSLTYDRGQRLVPFIEGGEGLLYTDLRGERLGGRFQFSSQAGVGLHWFVSENMALTAAYRLRHISDAGITRQNSGLNTDSFLLGVTYFPNR